MSGCLATKSFADALIRLLADDGTRGVLADSAIGRAWESDEPRIIDGTMSVSARALSLGRPQGIPKGAQIA